MLDREVTGMTSGVLVRKSPGLMLTVEVPLRLAQSRFAVDAAVAQVFGLNPHLMSGSTRGRANAAFARQVAMYVTHVSCGMNLTDVGALYARDRTTVSHACALIEDLRDDPIFDRLLQLLEWVVRALMARAHLTVAPQSLFKF